ncbi:MAG: hypothetical protein HYS40_08385 [Gemmatimonadetes bacterium]|nr:hypothetical protein [Gemmatimonadota bacterium]
MSPGSFPRSIRLLAVALALAGLGACDAEQDLTRPAAASRVSAATAAPTPLVTVSAGPSAVEFWPFLGTDFSGAPQDPINLLFAGQSDPRALRAALLMLDGDRTAFGFPDVFPFNCTWRDAIGDVETAFATGAGWLGATVQVACGDYGPVRFHLRLADAGVWTLANGHFEVLIPGTTEHQVLSWKLAEQLVMVDLLRTGLLDPSLPLFSTDQINPAPFRDIPAVIYNGLPLELRGAIGGPLADVADAMPIGTDGHATVLNVAGQVDGQPGVARQDFVIDFNQVIPKPVCTSGPFDFIHVQGPVRLRQQVVLTPSGDYASNFHADGHLDITPVNPLTDPPTPIGETYRALVVERHTGIMTDDVSLTSSVQLRILIPPSAPFHGRLQVNLQVGPGGSSRSVLSLTCN